MTYTIGEVAKSLGISAHTLRVWEQEGLIPAPARTMVGHRKYDKQDIETIRQFITSRHHQGNPVYGLYPI